MTKVSDFSITSGRWAMRTPGAIQLYSFPTPNGVKVSIALEELGLPYDAHTVSILKNDQFDPDFLAISPNNKIPAILDPEGPGGAPITLFESGAILVYLADKTDRLIPQGVGRYEVLQWLMFQMGGLGPMFGQLGFFHSFAGKDIADPRPKERYRAEAARLLKVLDQQLEGREWVAGDYSIADIAIAPWLRTLRDYYGAGEITGVFDLAHVPGYLDRFLARPAVERGSVQPPRE